MRGAHILLFVFLSLVSLAWSQVNGINYIGCYADTRDSRILPELAAEKRGDMQSSLCRGMCQSRWPGWRFYGTQNYHECWCGDDGNYARFGIRSDSECNRMCDGNRNERCGGSFRMSTYRQISCTDWCFGKTGSCGEVNGATTCFGCTGNTEGSRCEICQAGYFGNPTVYQNCQPCQWCGTGYCNDRYGNGHCTCYGNWNPAYYGGPCTICKPGFFGGDCNGQCQNCQQGYCNEGTSGNGLCICNSGWTNGWAGGPCNVCTPGRFGSSCQFTCQNCQQGFCNQGTSGNGHCTCNNGWATSTFGGPCNICAPGRYGPSCLACPSCGQGSCRETLSGDGACACNSGWSQSLGPGQNLCDICSPGHFGAACAKCQNCGQGKCNEGINGDGRCTCNAGWARSSFDGPCDRCAPGYYGATCAKCQDCGNGYCNEGINGDGSCICYTGWARTNERCDKCADGYGKEDQSCAPCYSTCATCNTTESNQCNTCQGFFALQLGSCVSGCDDGKYRDQNNQCQDCHPNCFSCSGPSDSQCLECHPGKVLNSGKCIDSCPDGRFNRSSVCQECHPNCELCDGGEASDCSKCNAPFGLFNTTCMAECPVGFFINSSQICEGCHSSCYTCSGSAANNCTSCTEPYALTQTDACTQVCPNGFYKSSTTCKTCHVSCANCFGPTSNNCTGCSQDLFLFPPDGTCRIECPDHFYYDANKTCKVCHPSCDQCDGGSELECLKCKEGFFRDGSRCVQTCPPGKLNNTNAVCQNCFSLCETCTDFGVQSCLSCRFGLIRDQGSCISRCFGFKFNQTGECVGCNCNGHSNFCDSKTGECLQCSNSTTGHNCEKCLPGSYRPNGTLSDGCIPCFCNGNSKKCNETTGECVECESNTKGTSCELCVDGYTRLNGTTACVVILPFTDEFEREVRRLKLSVVAIALIAVGGVCVCCLLFAGLLFFFRKRYNYKTILTKYIPAKPEVNESEIALQQFEAFGSSSQSRNFDPTKTVDSTALRTMLNTQIGKEISLPGYLLLNFSEDIRKEKTIGSGGAGNIYFGVLINTDLRQKFPQYADSIAIKIVEDRESLTPEDNERMFHQEVSILSALSFHPNICKLIGYFDKPRGIVTPLYQGDLHKLVHNKSHSFSSRDVLDIARQLAFGMQAVHSLGIAHRDVKPANFLLEKRVAPATTKTMTFRKTNLSTFPYTIKIADFGVCCVSQSVVTSQKFINVFGVSVRYAAPEVFARMMMQNFEGDVDEFQKSDVFSYAISLWEILYRQIPWPELTTEEIQQHVCNDDRPPIEEGETDVMKATVIGLIKACWVTEHDNRPAFQDIFDKLYAIEKGFDESSNLMDKLASPSTFSDPVH